MSEEPSDDVLPWRRSMREMSRKLAAVSFAIAMVAFVGRIAGSHQLSSAVTGWESMTLASAAAQALIATVLASRSAGLRWHKPVLGISFGISAAVLLSHALRGEDFVSPAFGELVGDTRAQLAHMSIGTALSTLLLSAANWPSPRWPRPQHRDTAASVVFVITLLALIAYAYGPNDVGDLTPLRSMSVNSAASLMLLAASTIAARPESGWAAVIADPGEAGNVTRRQMIFVSVPVVLGFVLVQASRSGGLSLGAAMALLVVFTAAPLLWLVLRDGRRLVVLEEERSERLRLQQRYGAELQTRLDAQAAELEASNAQLLAHAEAASVRSEGRFRQLFDTIDAGFAAIEMKFDAAGQPVDFRFVEVNAAFARQTGLRDPEGKWMRELVPQNEQYWFDMFGKVARTGASARYENVASESGGRWFDISAFRIGGGVGGQVGMLVTDITQRRTIELQLKAMNETLEQRVEAAIAEREEVQAVLRQSQKMEAIGQLTGGVAHDFNNLLTPIIGSLDLLIRRGGFGDREQRLINAALQSAERAKTLVQRLLAFARRQPLQPGPVDLGALVGNMAELVISTSGPQIEVAVDVAPDVPPAIGDANQLEMAILNLCVNARDAMPKGGRLTLSVASSDRPPPGHPDLSPGRYVRLSVADDGTGMDAETVSRAIEPFFSTKGIGKGTGLGLSMVHGLAMQLGGALTIDSKPGVGTRIDLFLKSGESEIAPASPAAEPGPSEASGRVLVVDDQEQVRMTTAQLLQELGFTTEECESGSVAELRLRHGEHFDLVVTDYLMPGLSGAELAARLATIRPGLPVLVVSGYVDADAIAPGLNFLRKPFRKDELAGAVDGALRDQGSRL